MDSYEYTRCIMEKVQPLLKRRKLTWKALAKKLGICYGTVCYYKSGGRRLSAHRVKAIADILEVPVQQLFPDDPPKPDMEA